MSDLIRLAGKGGVMIYQSHLYSTQEAKDAYIEETGEEAEGMPSIYGFEECKAESLLSFIRNGLGG